MEIEIPKWVEEIASFSHEMLTEVGEGEPTGYFRDAKGHMTMTVFAGLGGSVLRYSLGQMAKKCEAVEVVLVSSAWAAPPISKDEPFKIMPSEHPERRSILMVVWKTAKDGVMACWQADYDLDDDDKVVNLGPLKRVTHDIKANILEDVFG